MLSPPDRTLAHSGTVVLGISGARQNAAVSLCLNGQLEAFCEQERVTRVRRAPLVAGKLPREAIEAVLASAGGLKYADVERYASAEASIDLPAAVPAVRVDHHLAHATTAYYLSPFPTAVVLVCDRGASEPFTVWAAKDGRIDRQDWPATGEGLAAIYSAASELFGLPQGAEHELEALARLETGSDADRLGDLFSYRDGAIHADARWRAVLSDWLAEPTSDPLTHRARAAGALQRSLGRMLLQLVTDLAGRTGHQYLCLGGGFFYNTYFTTLAQQSGAFNDVFVAPNPGNAGAAIGAALHAAQHPARESRRPISPFLGPQFSTEDVKRTLDNCKITYEYLDGRALVHTTVEALLRGQLVAWFQGRMEWGHRALGNRSILANPLSPYVLDNLNVFLKHRQRHRTYGVSVPAEHVSTFFDGPAHSHFMEYEYRVRQPEQFRHVLPERAHSLRVQTVPTRADGGSSELYRALHDGVAGVTGVPVLVNTSFNGFLEPMVCSPRDALRVFYGTGLDLLVIDRFVIRK